MPRYLTLSLLLLPFPAFAQAPPAVEWQRNLGGSQSDFANSVAQTTDGGYIICGTTFSNNGDVFGNHGQADIWVVKLDALGTIQWQRCLGGTGFDFGRSVLQRTDGGYLVLGTTSSSNGDVSGNHGESDIWLAKLDASGALLWQRCYGGTLAESAWDIKITPDGYVIVGESQSSDGDLTTNAGAGDYWILKVDEEGAIQWQRSYGGSFFDGASRVALTADGGYIVNGYTESNNGDVGGFHGFRDYWVLKLDAQGMLQWQRPCGGSGDDWGSSITEMDNGDILATGYSMSQDGDVTPGILIQDVWTIRLSAMGEVLDDRSYGGSNIDFGGNLMALNDSGLIYWGSSSSNDGDVPGNQGEVDGWVFRTDAQGDILWNLTMGGSQIDGWGALQATGDGGYILAGASQSNDGDLPGNHGSSDFWVVKLGPDPLSVHEVLHEESLRVFPNPSSDRIQVELPTSMRNAHWQLHDVHGKVVAMGRAVGTEQVFAIQQLAAGAYTLVVEAQGMRRSVVVVKE